MTRITGTDQVLLLLRERLQRMERGRGGAAARTGSGAPAARPPLARLQARAALDEVSGEDMGRGLVRAILTEEMGEALANDVSFAAIMNEVYRIISESEEGRALLDRAATDLARPA